MNTPTEKSIDDIMNLISKMSDPTVAFWGQTLTALAEVRGLLPPLPGEEEITEEHIKSCAPHALAAELQKHANSIKANVIDSCACHFCNRKKDNWNINSCCAFCSVVIFQATEAIEKARRNADEMEKTKMVYLLNRIDTLTPANLPEQIEEQLGPAVDLFNRTAKDLYNNTQSTESIN